MGEKVKAVIIGAGSAGLSALRQVKKRTDKWLIIDNGPTGTKCASTGCMPSKVLISVANCFHQRKLMQERGLFDNNDKPANIPAVLSHVRQLRDQFTNGMKETTRKLAGENFINAKAKIVSANKVLAGNEEIETDSIIIATGSSPIIVPGWEKLGSRILTNQTIFEQRDLPAKIAVIGLGAIGLELAQALSRLGLHITGFAKDPLVILTDPEIRKKTRDVLQRDFPMYLEKAVELEEQESGEILVKHPDSEIYVDAVIAAIGVRPAVEGLGLENLGVELDKRHLPGYNGRTTQIEDLPVYIAGDVNGCRPVLHEAIDEGLIAGTNAVSETVECFERRTSMTIVFTHPQIALVGSKYSELKENERSFVIGRADFSEQARAKVELSNAGMLDLYADTDTAAVLGAELIAPGGEHLAHQIAQAVENKMTVFDMLQMPFYHPTVEEGLRSALRNAAKQLSAEVKRAELNLCQSSPEDPLC